MIKPVIRAIITFLSHEEGGRASMPGLSNGQFKPHIVIQSPDVRSAKKVNGLCVDDYLGVRFTPSWVELVPGEQFDLEMELMYYPNVNYDSVQVGETFTLREGGKVIGYGVVSKRIEHDGLRHD